ncbi:IclR family transcriptional regulator [Mesorhizobium sp. SP-1A]|uniref:IclR family transcriptional regulator n=1 Tax=Mesorhizobium sp. SP-1A TaxID=3077840 RepID=UPI0028F7340F|nr:IclR family transcriptional regulator [Mesorhizobium sp. SP-1A]
MRTVGKALTILDLFTEQRPSLTLTEIARATGIDTATCHRMLKVLERHGYVFRQAATKHYSLGATVLRLARTREITTPMSATLQAVVDALTEKVSETSHASVIAGQQVATVAAREGTRSNRVHVEYGARMELHATATGLACLAYADAAFVEHALAAQMTRFTATTVSNAKALEEALSLTRSRGYSVADCSFDADVVGVGAPFFNADGIAMGAVAVATPANRMNAPNLARTALEVMAAGIEATRRLGGIPPQDFLDLYRLMAARDDAA